jgi:hypothetical protein
VKVRTEYELREEGFGVKIDVVNIIFLTDVVNKLFDY